MPDRRSSAGPPDEKAAAPIGKPGQRQGFSNDSDTEYTKSQPDYQPRAHVPDAVWFADHPDQEYRIRLPHPSDGPIWSLQYSQPMRFYLAIRRSDGAFLALHYNPGSRLPLNAGALWAALSEAVAKANGGR